MYRDAALKGEGLDEEQYRTGGYVKIIRKQLLENQLFERKLL